MSKRGGSVSNFEFINILRECLGKNPIRHDREPKEIPTRDSLPLVCNCGLEFQTQAQARGHFLYYLRLGKSCEKKIKSA